MLAKKWGGEEAATRDGGGAEALGKGDSQGIGSPKAEAQESQKWSTHCLRQDRSLTEKR
jgi:hypothetical protein